MIGGADVLNTPYVGSGPYCYANSLAMCTGDTGFSAADIEVLTGSPFGFELLFGNIPLFDPWGWDPVIGTTDALDLLGCTAKHTSGDNETDAVDRLRQGVEHGPVLAGPMEMGLLLQHPGSGQPWFSDHFVAVVAVDAEEVTFHDPHGFPYSTLPVDAFIAAWRTDTIGYVDEHFAMWCEFERRSDPSRETALGIALTRGATWADSRRVAPPEDGTLVASVGILALADMVESGIEPWQHGHLVNFAVRLGARRLIDASAAARAVDRSEAADHLAAMARMVGSTHHPLVVNDHHTVAERLRRVAPLYDELASKLL